MASKGLEDVEATSSKVCYIDGKKGILSYRGYDIKDLSDNSNFEETSYLLLYGELPTTKQLDEFQKQMKENRNIPESVISIIKSSSKDTELMDILRTSISALASSDPEYKDNNHEVRIRKSIRIISKIATVLAVVERTRKNEELIEPNNSLKHAENFLYMINGEKPPEKDSEVLDKCLILHADHELNASTFAARVTVSTLSDVYSAVTSAIGTLKGPLHGGANERVMEMLDEIKEPDRVAPHLDNLLENKQKVMGFGHRVYKTIDPRATILRKLAEEMSSKSPNKYFEMSLKMEEIMNQKKGLRPNVDFYAASVYNMMNIPKHLFTPIFACSRSSGWCAHILEQLQDNRLIRPRSDYDGEIDRIHSNIDSR
jgi:citrate synthase|tara:strand:+ start:1046 stop:2158 length:1113 start_codon:yes stop_codon:yes gene_type:complete